MTISSSTNKVQIASGSSINITNLEAQNEDQVLITKTDANGVETVLSIVTDYTINASVTTVTLVSALSTDELATATLTIPRTQTTDYRNSSALNAETIETALDKVTLIDKEIQEQLDRSIKFNISVTNTDLEIPDPTNNEDKFLKLNATGDAFEFADDTSIIGGLSKADGTFYVGDGTSIAAESGATARASMGVGSADSPQFTAIELGDTSDTTITRVSPGKIAVEGVNVVTTSSTDTLTNKTLTAPVISTISNTGTLTLPTSTDTLIGRATTDTLTNKTINANATGNSITNIEVADLAAGVLDTDLTSVSASDDTIPSAKAVKTYVDNSITGLLDFKGSTDASSNPNYPSASKGDAYYINVAGKIGGASGKSVEIGDVYIAAADNAGGTEASVGTSWFVLEHNLVGALVSGGALGTPSSGTLTNCNGLPEAGITLADNTTNNSSTSSHGFLKKLDNNANHFMDGLGNWSTPTVSGGVLQVVNTQTGSVATGTTTVPLDDTIPQNTEGDQYLSLAITPSNVSNFLIIDVTLNLSSSDTAEIISSIFQDSGANALFTTEQTCVGGAVHRINFKYYMTAGTTSATTFTVRSGPHTASTLTLNGFGSARKMGGVMISGMTITEIKA